MFAIALGVAFSACTDDPTENGKEPIAPVIGEVIVDVKLDYAKPSGAVINVKTQYISEFAYVVGNELDAAAIFKAGAENKKTISNVAKLTNTKITLQGLEKSTEYVAYFAFRQSDDVLREEVVAVNFTTTDYGDNVITVTNRKLDGFELYVQIPADVKEAGNALRYATSSLPMYNYSKMEGGMEIDMLVFNAGQYTTDDTYIRYDEYYNYERDEYGEMIAEGAEYSDPKVPGEPGVFLIGEYSYMNNTEERICLVDEDGDGDYELVSVFDELTYLDKTVWAYPAGWKPGFYRPEYDFVRWANEVGTDSYDTEKYWTGYYEKQLIMTIEPEILKGNVAIEVTDVTPIDATITFTPSDDVLFYSIFICSDSEYQTNVLPLLDNKEEYLRWFVGSYFAMMSFGTQVKDGVGYLHLNAAEYGENGWFTDTKGMAGQTIHVFVAGMGDRNGKTQCFSSTSFELPEVKLPKPEIEVSAVDSNDPYTASFVIKNPNWETNKITQAKYACNYVREYDAILKEYSYTDLLKSMGNAFTKTDLEAINSEAGLIFNVPSRDNESTRLAVLGYNWEGSGNNPDAPGSTAVAETTTANAKFPSRVDSPLFEKLVGEWVATAPMKKYIAATETEKERWESVGNYTSEVAISAGIEYPETLPQNVYDIYAKGGFNKAQVDELYDEFKSFAKWYNTRTRGYNRLLCMGYNFADADFHLDQWATPYELFYAEDYSVSKTRYMFYDFGPKWNLEIDADGKVWLPIDIEREYPLEAFNYGIDRTFYMLGVGEKSYIGAPVYKEDENGKTLLIDSRFPVEISDDFNTITIKPIKYTYFEEGSTQARNEYYYPCVAQLQNGYATPLNPRVCGDVVLTRKSGATRAAVNASVGNAATTVVSSVGEAPVPMKPVYSMTSLDAYESKIAKPIIRKEPYDNSEEAYHARVRALFKKIYGVDFPAKR